MLYLLAAKVIIIFDLRNFFFRFFSQVALFVISNTAFHPFPLFPHGEFCR